MEKQHHKTWHHKHLESLSLGQRISDRIVKIMGSWGFIIFQTTLIVTWTTLNFIAFKYRWDPFPFILLNLLFSTQAAYAAPIIMMAQNRQGERDRAQALDDYHTNLEAKEEIEQLQSHLARIEAHKLDKIIAILEGKIEDRK